METLHFIQATLKELQIELKPDIAYFTIIYIAGEPIALKKQFTYSLHLWYFMTLVQSEESIDLEY